MTQTQSIEMLTADAQKAMTGGMETFAKSFEDVAAFNRDGMDAFMRAAGVAMKTAEEMNAEIASFAKRSAEESVAAAKELAASKTLAEAVEKQTGYAKVAVDGLFDQATRMNEMAMAASKAAMAPLSARMSAAVDLVKPSA